MTGNQGGPRQGGPRPGGPRLTLYGRAWCHLCDDMLAALAPLAAEFGAHVDIVDIDTDPQLEARYDVLVPVLVHDGVELCHYRLDTAGVRAALAATRAARPA